VGAEAPGGADDDALRDLALLTDAVARAGERAFGLQGKPLKQWTKPDGSPVSEADVAVDEALADLLRAQRPDYGWISEELGGAVSSGRSFVVDPIDGTRAFLRGEDQWSVVAAVIEAGRPMAAAVCRPARGEIYTAVRGGGATRNGSPIAVSSRTALAGATVAMPGALWRDAGFRDAGVKRGGWISSLALRLCRVARGAPDAVVTKPGPHHWDLAAADLIIHEAGGNLTTLAGGLPRYDRGESRHGQVVAGPAALAETLRQMAAPHEARII
jgi:myo-inositol-1(or 4)-monophosphatase